MGEVAAVVGGRQWADRGSAAGQSDDELVAAVRAGDPAGFEQIYDRYARGILAFCVHMLGNREAAEDALQLTFVSAYRALRGGESSIALRPWLYTIARNRCLTELRARRDAVCVDELVTDQPVIDGLADQVQRREDLREMLDDMRRLPADQRAALVLFELGDQPQKEIATVLGVRTEKVKALVFQAREALVRGRQARQHPCREIREQMATLEGRIPARSMLRAHIERCPGCQSFEHEVRHQRAALALILPVALTGELKSWILGSAVHGSRAVAAGVGACGGGGGAVAAGGGGGAVAAGGGAVVAGAGACGGSALVGGLGGGGALSATAAGGLAGVGVGAGAGAGALASGAPLAMAAAGLTAAAGETVTGLSATGVVAKLLTAAAIATVAASSGHVGKPLPAPHPTSDPARQGLLASAAPVAAPPVVHPTSTGSPLSVTATPLGSPASAPSSTPAGAAGSTASTSATAPNGAGASASSNPAGTPAGTITPTATTPSSPQTSSPTTTTTDSPSSGSSSTGTSGSGGDTPAAVPASPAASTSSTASSPAASTSSAPTTTDTSSTNTPSGGSTGSNAPTAPADTSASAGTSGTSTDATTVAAPATSPAVDPSASSSNTASSAAVAPATTASSTGSSTTVSSGS